MSDEFDFEAYCANPLDNTTLAICTIQTEVTGIHYGVDAFFLIFAVRYKKKTCLINFQDNSFSDISLWNSIETTINVETPRS
jgi:hypothetical protein